jgi:hypothetical protein
MSQTRTFIERLDALQEGDRSRLRSLAGQPLDKTLAGFDLFTGLWWPLRQSSPVAPRRETSWLIAKLYGTFPIPHVKPMDTHDCPTLPRLLGQLEPRDEKQQPRFRGRFDALLCSSLPGLEPHLYWALRVIVDAVNAKKATGLDWAELLDDLSIWDRAVQHRRRRDIRDIWAEQYLNAASHSQGAKYVD